MSQPSKRKSAESIPVHSSRPGERYVRVDELLRNEGVQKQIRKMAEIAEGGKSLHKQRPKRS